MFTKNISTVCNICMRKTVCFKRCLAKKVSINKSSFIVQWLSSIERSLSTTGVSRRVSVTLCEQLGIWDGCPPGFSCFTLLQISFYRFLYSHLIHFVRFTFCPSTGVSYLVNRRPNLALSFSNRSLILSHLST